MSEPLTSAALTAAIIRENIKRLGLDEPYQRYVNAKSDEERAAAITETLKRLDADSK